MILHDYIWKVRASAPRRIYFLGDLHVGNASFDEKNCREVIRIIEADEHGRYFFMGDGAECITIKDKRWEFDAIDRRFHQSIDYLPQAQINYVCELLEPIKGKCIGYHAGNHETSIRNRNQSYDPMFDYHTLFLKPGKGLGSDVAITEIHFKSNKRVDKIKVFTTHGSGGATTPAGKLNNLLKLADSFPNNTIYARGHLHDCGIHAKPALDKDEDDLAEHRRLFVASGCYFKTYAVGHPSYAARNIYSATELGTPYIEISYPGKSKKLKMSFGILPG